MLVIYFLVSFGFGFQALLMGSEFGNTNVGSCEPLLVWLTLYGLLEVILIVVRILACQVKVEASTVVCSVASMAARKEQLYCSELLVFAIFGWLVKGKSMSQHPGNYQNECYAYFAWMDTTVRYMFYIQLVYITGGVLYVIDDAVSYFCQNREQTEHVPLLV